MTNSHLLRKAGFDIVISNKESIMYVDIRHKLFETYTIDIVKVIFNNVKTPKYKSKHLIGFGIANSALTCLQFTLEAYIGLIVSENKEFALKHNLK